ncbi:hypothetical protein [Kitasatospora sp. NPDC093558]|uniref:hypothetical protein n=1 Tax=Kitasatospora sp. NPDC093558 TaxID=3155201 RepID=UPI00343277DF
MRNRRGAVGAVAMAVASGLLTLAGCGGGHSVPSAGPAPESAGASSPYPATAERPGSDPSTWTLPMLAYQPTQEQEKAIGQAETKLVGDCMARLGVAWQPAPDLPPVGPKNLLDRRYGIHDAALAATRGYQPDADEVARHDGAMRAQSSAPKSSPDVEVYLGGTDLPPDLLAQADAETRNAAAPGGKIPPGGCFGEARRTLGSPTRGLTPLVDHLTYQSFPDSLQDPQVKAVFAQWSACMNAKGLRYRAPLDANDDPTFEPGAKGVTRQEISTALADLACRDRHHVAEVWHDAESRLQQQEIAANREALEADRHTLDAVLAKTADVLARH